MKKLLIGLLVLGSFSAFAQSTKVVCGNGTNDSGKALSEAILNAERNLNGKLENISKVIRTSAPTIQILDNSQYWYQSVAICVTVETK